MKKKKEEKGGKRIRIKKNFPKWGWKVGIWGQIYIRIAEDVLFGKDIFNIILRFTDLGKMNKKKSYGLCNTDYGK